PGRAEDHVARAAVADGVLAGELAGAVGAERGGRVVLAIRARRAAVEDVIGRIVDQQRIARRTRGGQLPGRLRIGAEGRVTFTFGTIDGGVGRGVHHDVGRGAGDQG